MLNNKKQFLKEVYIFFLAVVIVFSSGALLANKNNYKVSTYTTEDVFYSPHFKFIDSEVNNQQNTSLNLNMVIKEENLIISNFNYKKTPDSHLDVLKSYIIGRLDYDIPTLDNTAFETNNQGASNMTWTHTVSTGLNNSILIVGTNVEEGAHDNYYVTSANYNNDPLIRAVRVAADEGYAAVSEIWYLLNPDEGTHTVRINFSQSIQQALGGSASFYNVEQESPYHTNTAANTSSPNGLLTTINTEVANSLIIAVATDGQGTLVYSYGNNQIQIYNVAGNSHEGAGSYKLSTAAGSSTMYTNLSGASNIMSQVVASWTPSSTPTNQPPYVPSTPSPANGAVDVGINVDLSWVGGDPDGDPVTYDVYFGTVVSPPKVVSNQSSTSYDPGALNYETKYYWKIVSWDDQGATNTGPIWSFTTEETPNQPPYVPSNPFPANGAINVNINADLSWTGGDPDGDPVTYDIYFGTTTTPPKIVSNQTSTSYGPGTMNYETTYYWKIVAWDNNGASSNSPVWSFTTEETPNQPPYIPSNPSPANGATNIPINTSLNWTGGDPDGDPVTYDVYFGTAASPPKIVSNQTSTSYDPGTMEFNTTYYWMIVAWDIIGESTWGSVWHFTTSDQVNRPPNTPVIDGVLGFIVPNRPYDYEFTSSDPDGDDVFYYVDWGDSTYDDWNGPYLNGEVVIISHTWPAKTKVYQIKAKAKDIYGEESDWGTFLVFVLSPRNSDSSLFIRFIQRFPILQQILIIIQQINRIIKF